MRSQTRDSNRDPMNLLRETVFYSPKVENLRTDNQVTKTKSEKFFRAPASPDSNPNLGSNLINTKTSFATSTIINFNTEPDRPATEALTYRNPARFLKIQTSANTTDDKIALTFRESNYDIYEPRTSKQDIIDEMLSTQNKDEIRKIYTAASEFRSLAMGGTEYSDRAIGKNKFKTDKKTNLVSKVKKINRDITHVLDNKPSREEFTPVHDPTISLPEVKSHHIQKFRMFIESIQKNDTMYPKSINFSLTERKGSNPFDLELRNTNFLAGSVSPDRSNSNRVNSGTVEDFRSTFTSLGKIGSGEVSDRAKTHPKISVLDYHYPYHTFGKFDTSENSYFASLKKILPSIFTSSSVSRPEVVLMGTWLMSTIDLLNKDVKMDVRERLVRADEIYNICLSELIRQVSCECVERAELLTQVWKAYINLTEDVLKENKERENEALARAKDEVFKTQSLYLKIISEKDQELLEAEEQLRQLQTRFNKEQKEKEEFQKRVINLEKENKKLMNNNDKYKKHYGLAVKECKDWEFKYQKIKRDYGAAEVEIEEESIPVIKAKAKTYEELSSSSDEDVQVLKRANTKVFGAPKFKVVQTEEKGTDYSYEEPIIPTSNKECQSKLFLIDHKYDNIFKDNHTINNIIMEELIKDQLLKQGELIETMLASEFLGEEELKRIEGMVMVDKLRHIQPDLSSFGNVEELKTPEKGQVPSSEENIRNSSQPRSEKSISEKPGEDSATNRASQSPEIKSLTQVQKINQNILFKLQKAIQSSSPRNKGSQNSLTHLLPPGGVIEEEENEKSMVINSKSSIDESPKGHFAETSMPNIMRNQSDSSPRNQNYKREGSISKSEPQINIQPVTVTKLSIPIINNDSEEEHEQEPDGGERQNTEQDQENEQEQVSFNETKPAIRIKPVFTRMNSLSSQTSIEEDLEGEMKEDENKLQAPGGTNATNIKKLFNKKKLGFGEKLRSTILASAPVTPKAGGIDSHIILRSGDRNSTSKLAAFNLNLMDKSSPTSLSIIDKIKSLSKSSKIIKSLNSQSSLDPDVQKSPGDQNKKPAPSSAINLIKNLSDKLTTKGLKSMTNLQNLDKNSLAVFEHEEKKIAHFITMYKVEKKKQEEMTDVAKTLESQIKKDQELIRNLQAMLEVALRGGLHHDQVHHLFQQISDRSDEYDKLSNTKLKLFNTLSSPQEEEAKDHGDVKIITPRYKEPTKEFVYQGSFSRNSMVILKKQMLLEKKNNPAPAIVKKIKSSFNSRLAKSKSVIPLKSILKQITNFYQERIKMAKENPMIKDFDMTTFVYRYFINTFGFNKFSLEKFGKFVLSVKKHSQNPRVMKFAKMLGILEEGNNYSFEEAKQFIAGIEFLHNNTSYGVNVQNSDHDTKHYVPWTRAAEYIRIFGEKHMRLEEINDLKRDIEKLKVSDPSGRNLPGVIDIDLFLDRIVMRYQQLMSKHRESYKTAFKCADLLSDNKVGYMEFTAMFKMIEPEKFDEKKTEEILLNYCDIIQEEEIGLSFEKFFSACFDHNLFSEYKLNSYIGLGRETDLDKMFDELKEKWPGEMKALQDKVEEHKTNVPLHVIHLWTTALNSIDKNVQEGTKIAKKASLIGFKLISNDIYNSLGKN